MHSGYQRLGVPEHLLVGVGDVVALALMINQFGGLFTGNANIIGVIAAVIVLAAIIYMLVRPYKEATKLTTKVEM